MLMLMNFKKDQLCKIKDDDEKKVIENLEAKIKEYDKRN